MDWFSGIVMFILIWWVTIFTVLPWSLKRDKHGRPDDPKLWRKILITTGISAILWLIFYIVIHMEIVDFRQIAASMAGEE